MKKTDTGNGKDDILTAAHAARWEPGINFHDEVIESIYADASSIVRRSVRQKGEKAAYSTDLKIDRIVTSKWLGFPLMFLMLFSLLHNPCSTTIYTIYKETGNVKWTLISTFLPILQGLIVCFFTTQIWHLLT